MKEKNGFFLDVDKKMEILTKRFFGCNVLFDF